MKITVIVTTYDLVRLKDTIEAVNSLLDQTYPEKEIMVVVDRNEVLYSKLKVILPAQIKIILSKDGGLSNSRNEGIRIANSPIIAFMDDDAVADKNWLSTLIQNYDDPNVIGAGGSIRPLWLGNENYRFPEVLYWIIGCTYKGYPETECSVRNNFGGNLSFRKEIFNTVLFCSDLGRIGSVQLTSDDTELSINALRIFPKSQIKYNPKALVYHRIYPYRLSIKYIIRRVYGDGLSKAFISKKYRNNALSSENQYLKTLLTKSFPNEIEKILFGKRKLQALRNLTLEIIVLATMTTGYLRGKMKW